jgi:hypothetical protein
VNNLHQLFEPFKYVVGILGSAKFFFGRHFALYNAVGACAVAWITLGFCCEIDFGEDVVDHLGFDGHILIHDDAVLTLFFYEFFFSGVEILCVDYWIEGLI